MCSCDPGPLIDGDLSLIVRELYPGDPARSYVPAYRFKLTLTASGVEIGGIDLRIGNTERLVRYGGHIGYGVAEAYRGHHYAARACKLLFPLAQRHGFETIWITCNPDNWASRRTCELAGGRLVEIVDLPPDNDMYQRGERQKCRYRFDLGAGSTS